MKIEIKVRGNPGLYRSLRESFAKESTTHRTYTGAARRIVALDRKSKVWAETTGQWGGWSIIIDGISLDDSIAEWCCPSLEDVRYYTFGTDPVGYIAKEIAKRHEAVIHKK